MLSEQQAEQIKKQLFEQVKKLPEEKRTLLQQNIEDMNPEELEEFLLKNNLIKSKQTECIFCSIIKKQTPSYIIDENEAVLAVLEINPISQGHVIIIPKEHSDKPQPQAIELAQSISEKIKRVFKPKTIKIESTNLFGHEIINVLPIYKDETLESPKIKAEPEQLQEIQKKLTQHLEEPKPQHKEKKEEIISDKNTWLPRRIP
jgi:diadenosine tetraphosphate (Ap4A) HIT family hydrolase